MREEIVFTKGMYFNEPSEKAPDFIKGSISIEPKQFTNWLRENYNKNEKYIKIDLKISKAGKAYSCLNTYKGTKTGNGSHRNVSQQSESKQEQMSDDGFVDDIPF